MRLNYWTAGTVERIYVQGLPGAQGKAYLSLARGGKLSLTVEDANEPIPVLLQRLLVGRGVDAALPPHQLWSALKAIASSDAVPRAPRAVPGASRFEESLPERASGRDLAFDNILNEAQVEIEVDHREPAEFVGLLGQVDNMVVTRTTLELGDFRINGGRVLVERKTVRDFALSVQDGRVFDQAQRIGFEPGCMGVVIIEGDPFREHTGMLASAVTGAITCLSMVQGMSVICTMGMSHTAYVLAKLAQHERNGLGYELPTQRAKPTQLLDAQRYLLEGVNGVSANIAQMLLAHFGSVRAVANASQAELQAVRGIGPKTAARIVAVFGG